MVFENERFKVTKDKAGRFWLWNKVLEQNFAMKSESEIDCYREAINLMTYSLNSAQEQRDLLFRKLDKVENLFEELFPPEDY